VGNFGKQPAREIYLLTAAGRKQLKAELETWDRLSTAIALVLKQIPEASS
jgi:PadR family transcriptional regulator, regulatory protein PadR